MFSRNRFNGQHGTGVTPKAAAKAKVHSPKKRAPNPKVALVIRGKIHRLLQGSTDHHVPESHLYYAGLEETEGEMQESRKGHRSVYPNHSPRAEAYSVSNGKGHRAPAGPPCVGEVELNREGCKRIPCTLQSKSHGAPANLKQISFKGDIQTSPEQRREPLHYRTVGPDMNGSQLTGACKRGFPAPCIRPKRPYSTGDYVDYNFNKTAPGMLLEEDEDKEEESSAVIEHILKELRGINKIQEEISDLRDYLSSVRGSVEEVSSCVDAVLLEIEGIRSTNRAVSGVHPGTWSGVGYKDRQSPHNRPSSAYGSLGSAIPKSHSNFLSHDHNECHGFRAESVLLGAEVPAVCPTAESLDHEELEDQEENSDHSSDIPVGALARKPNFGYQEGQECLSTSSLSSGHSSKSEVDLEGPCCTEECKQEVAEDGVKHWTNREPLHGSTRESMWHREPAYFRARSLEENGDQSTLCSKETGHWDYYRDSASYPISRQGSTGSSECLSIPSGKRFNSPASTSSREEWQSRRRRPQSQSGIHVPRHTSFEALSVECKTEASYTEGPDYHSGRETEIFNYVQSDALSYTHSQVDSHQENYPAYEDSTQVAWPDASLCNIRVGVGRWGIQESAAGDQSLEIGALYPDCADIQAGGFNVKRISQAVFDFSSVLRGALRKRDVAATQNPEEADFELSMPYELQENDEVQFQQTSDKIQESNIKEYDTSVGELRKSNTLDELDRFSEEPMLEKSNKSLNASEFTDTYQFSNKIPDHRLSVQEPISSSTAILPPPDDLTGLPTEGPGEMTGDKTVASQPPERPGIANNLDEGPRELAKMVQYEVVQQPVVEIVATLEKEEGDTGEHPEDLSQMDERKLKCLRTFQQILREKRETRRNLATVTMSTFSQEDFEPGSHQ